MSAAGQASSHGTELVGHRKGVASVAFSPDGRWLASGGLDGVVRVWATGTWKLTHTFDHGEEVYSVAFAPDSRTLASSAGDNRVVLWDVEANRQLRATTLPTWSLALTFAPDGTLLVGSMDGAVRRFDGTLREKGAALASGNEVWSLTTSQDGRLLVTSVPIKLWELDTGAELANLVRRRGYGQGSVALAPGGRFLASGEAIGGARTWSLPDGMLLATLETNAERRAVGGAGFGRVSVAMPVTGVAFTPDGGTLATGGGDCLVRLWSVGPDGRLTSPAPVVLGAARMTITAIAISPDGAYLAASSLDRTVRVWPLGPRAGTQATGCS